MLSEKLSLNNSTWLAYRKLYSRLTLNDQRQIFLSLAHFFCPFQPKLPNPPFNILDVRSFSVRYDQENVKLKEREVAVSFSRTPGDCAVLY